MLKSLRKKRNAGVVPPSTENAAMTCGACGHLRETSSTSPEWQCPCCGKAYAKVNVSDEEHRRRIRAENRAQDEVRRESKKVQHQTLAGLYAGLFTFLGGLGSTCSGAATNPLVQAAGVLIALGAAAYGLHYYIS